MVDPATGTGPLAGALLYMELVDDTGAPTTGRVAGLVGENGSTNVLLNLNNLFDLATGETAETIADTVVRVTDYRGLACADPADQQRISFGRVPAHEETPPITELESLVDCFFADRVCDGAVDIVDAQFVLNSLNAVVGACDFNPYLDVVPDDEINILDAQAVLNRLNETAPFTP